MKKLVFISYSDSDRIKMRKVEKLITNSGCLEPIIIADNRSPLLQLSSKVSEGIKRCDYLVPILTTQSINTQWINQEIGFATALNKSIKPITESNILGNLKGFIHKQVDLPYCFLPNIKASIEERNFQAVAKNLVNDILIENGLKQLDIEDLFKGDWENFYSGTNNGNEKVVIKDKEYYSNGKYWFDIKDVKIDLAKKQILFVKQGRGSDTRRLKTSLRIIKPFEHYEGTEEFGRIKNTVIYRKKFIPDTIQAFPKRNTNPLEISKMVNSLQSNIPEIKTIVRRSTANTLHWIIKPYNIDDLRLIVEKISLITENKLQILLFSESNERG